MYHVSQYAEQRAIECEAPPAIIDLLLKYGHWRQASDGCRRVVLDKTGARKARKYFGHGGSPLIDRARSFVLITDEPDQVLVTVIPDRMQQYREQLRPWKVH